MGDKVTNVPRSAGWLGGFGVVPFLGLTAALPWAIGSQRALLLTALLAYGAVILSFLGGIQWGLAIATPNRERLAARLGLSVVPSLLGWLALLLAGQPGLVLLAAGFAGMLWLDLESSRLGLAPPWYPRLRVPLSVTVIASLMLAGVL